MAKKVRIVTQVRTATVVSFFLGDEECAIPITDVHQIIRDVPITKVPNVNPNVEGVLNLRGMVVPIIDLKHLLGLGTRIITDQHRFLIVENDGRMVGFSADQVGGVFEYELDSVQAAPDVVLAKVRGEYVTGVVRREGNIVILLSMTEILALGGQKQGSEGGAAVGSRPMARA